VLVLAALTVTIGLGAQPILVFATQAAEQLIHPEDYVRAVLGAP
jgi:multicomponent Na+:H+ antiporter subunit D